jgi:hypothetical protein
MKEISRYAKFILTAAFTLLLLSGCKKDDNEAPDPNAIPKNTIRITADIKAPGIQPDDVFRVAGTFPRPDNNYNLASSYVLKKQADGTYRIDIPTERMIEAAENRFLFFISRNGKFAELKANCQPIEHEIWKPHYLGKEFKITVEAFQGTGNCPE